MANTTYLESKPRYEILDGLRGVGALIVVAFHLFETYSNGILNQKLNHGYLAVDFFFLLSGFVISYAYDDRWDRMTLGGFFKRRIVRLHPMLIMGTCIGAALYYFGAGEAFPLIAQTPWWKLLLITLMGCLMIPTSPKMDIRGWGEVTTLNGTAWSLMWEYMANIMYALFIRRLPKAILAILVLLFACLTIDVTMNIDIFGLFSNVRPDYAYTIIGGWATTPDQLYIGATRLLYPFFMGLLLARFQRLVSVRGGFWWCTLLVTVLLVMPRIGGETNMWQNGLYDAVCILIMFPLVVSMGAGSKITNPRSIAVCKFLGEISYPLYITHFPLIYLHIAWAKNNPDASLGQTIFISVSVFVLAIGIAYACLKLYDLPLREWLKKHWLMKK